MQSYVLKPIGIIHTPFLTKDKAPIQGAFHPDIKGDVVVFPEFSKGLTDIESFSHIILLYLFHKHGEIKLVRPPFLDDTPHGLFSSRHPCRPNSIGLTIVGLVGKKDNILEVKGIDVLDKTPLLDIKPYVPRFDCYPDASEGWMTGKDLRPKPVDRE